MSMFKKVLMLVALAGFVGACSGNSGSNNAPAGNNDVARDTTAAADDTAGAPMFAATHSGNFDITGWSGNTLLDVMDVSDLAVRVEGFDQLVLSIDTFEHMGAADGRRYEYDRTNKILRIYGAGHSLEVTSTGSMLSADAEPAGDQGQGQMTKEAPLALPCRLYEEEVKAEEQKAEPAQDQKGEVAQDQKSEPAVLDEKAVEQGQTAEQGQSQEQKQEEAPAPESVVVRCEQTITSEQEQGQSQAQVKPESRTEIIHVALNLTPVVEVKQEQIVEKEVKQEETKEVKQETKEVKQEQVVKEEKAPVKEEKKEVVKEEKQEQKGEVAKEEKKEEKKPGQGQG